MSDALRTVVVDGLSVSTTDQGAQAIQKLQSDLAEARRKLADAETKREEEDEAAEKKAKEDKAEREKEDEEHKKEVEAKDGKIAALEKQLADAAMTPEKIDAMVKDRATLIDKAAKVLGDKLVTDGKSDADIRKQVVAAQLGDAVIKDWSDDKIGGAFDALSASVKDAKPGNQVGSILLDRSGTQDAAVTAYEARNKRLQNAWKGNGQAA